MTDTGGQSGGVWRRLVPWLAVALWAAVIFCFSAQTGEQSGGLSGSLSDWIAVRTPGWTALSEAQRADRASLCQHLVRKAAHVTEFAVLGGLLMNAWARTARRAGWQQAALAVGCGLLWAAGDEFHQLFVPGRGPAVTDVLIDFSGVLLGACVLWTILRKCLKSRAYS